MFSISILSYYLAIVGFLQCQNPTFVFLRHYSYKTHTIILQNRSPTPLFK
nr:MAG TPA: hypothetical protein [Caudoviricetes sp.]